MGRGLLQRVTEYVRYSCEWGYADNTAAGEQVRMRARSGPELSGACADGVPLARVRSIPIMECPPGEGASQL